MGRGSHSRFRNRSPQGSGVVGCAEAESETVLSIRLLPFSSQFLAFDESSHVENNVSYDSVEEKDAIGQRLVEYRVIPAATCMMMKMIFSAQYAEAKCRSLDCVQ